MEVEFILNNKMVSTDQAPGMTLMDFVRYEKQLVGTKIGCREGDCGACTLLIGDLSDSQIRYRTVTSCLMPLSNAHGKHVVTVEGLNLEELNSVQQAIVRNGGTQCGFCTVGFVVSLSGFSLDLSEKTIDNAVAAMDGNICRCTGYKSLERAAQEVVNQLKTRKDQDQLEFLVDEGFIPSYFTEIPTKLIELNQRLAQSSVDRPKGNGKVKVGGGTDLYVQKPEDLVRSTLHNLKHNGAHGCWEDDGRIWFGTASTAEDLRSSPIVARAYPGIKGFLKLVSSTQIRNMGTIAGNFVNASPIGDLTIMFLAWDAQLILQGNGGSRNLALEDLFLDYKKLALEEGETIQHILIDADQKGHFNFEKVSKRTHLDIASVNSACYLETEENHIKTARLSAGGVAPVPLLLKETSTFLEGQEISHSTLIEANLIAQQEINPISDIRGSADYKKLLLRQLLYAHFLKLFPQFLEAEELLC